MERNLLHKFTFFYILFFVLTHAELIDFGNGNLATSTQNKFSGKNNLADGIYNNFKGTNNVAQGLLNNINGNSNIASGLGNTISGQGNFVSGQGNVVVSGNQMNFDQFQNNFNIPSVQDEISKRLQSIGVNSFANILTPPPTQVLTPPQIPNNGIQAASIQAKTMPVPSSSDKNIIASGPKNIPPSISTISGSQIPKSPQGTLNNKEIPLPRPVDNLPSLNTNSGTIDPSAQTITSYSQGNQNYVSQANTQNGINKIQNKGSPNTGFQTLQNLQNLQKMAEKPSMILMNLADQMSANRFNSDVYSQSWPNWNGNPFNLNQNQNYWAQALAKRYSALNQQNRINSNNLMYNVPLLPSYQASLAYQGYSNPYSQYNQIWLDNSNVFNGASGFSNYKPNYFGQNQPFFQQPGYMPNQQFFGSDQYSQVPSQNLMYSQYQQMGSQFQGQTNIRSTKVPEMGFLGQQIYQSPLQNGSPNYGIKTPQKIFTRY